MSSFMSTMRRFSRSSSVRSNSGNPSNAHYSQYPQSPPTSYTQHTQHPQSPPTSYSQVTSDQQRQSSALASHDPNDVRASTGSSNFESGYQSISYPTQSIVPTHHSRPISSATDASFDFANKPVTTNMYSNHEGISTSGGGGGGGTLPPSAVGNLSRTDQIVLKHFWESKYQENYKRDLHYLKFPFFPQQPSHRDLLPYCEIYHLVKTSPGANIISLGSANGVYIGFELRSGSQLHIDMDDEWHNITHHRVQFRPYDSVTRDPKSEATFKTWPKPLTIEFLEDQYSRWCEDLMSLCWEGREIRELGATTAHTTTTNTAGAAGANATGAGVGGVGSASGAVGSVGGNNTGGGVGGGESSQHAVPSSSAGKLDHRGSITSAGGSAENRHGRISSSAAGTRSEHEGDGGDGYDG